MIRLKLTRDTVSPMMRRLTDSFSSGNIAKLYSKIGNEFKRRTLANFGASGPDRPFAWQKLTPRYAKRVKRDFATLVVSGQLRDSIQVSASENGAEVWSDCRYSAAHQFGYSKNNLPARPYFPVHGMATPTEQLDAAVVKIVKRHAKVS